MTAPTLTDVLADILAGNPAPAVLSGGLMFQYKEPDAEHPTHRLFCYRRGQTPPSTTEFITLRRHLLPLIDGRELTLGSEYQYLASDREYRTGRVFAWLPDRAQ